MTSPVHSVPSTSRWPITQYTPRYTDWPYKPSDFQRQDESSDASFYKPSRFVTHIDDRAIEVLSKYYDVVLPRDGRILDFCSSWISHYPIAIEDAVKQNQLQIVGMGMNKAELDKNAILNAGIVVKDLNITPQITQRDTGGEVDASTCVVSIDYLTDPVKVLESLKAITRPGGKVHLVISNRCFPTKATRRWLQVDEGERLQMVGDYLHFAGWKNIEIVELSSRQGEAGAPPASQTTQQSSQPATWLSSLLGGIAGHDPLWVVRAVKGPTS